MNAVRMGRVAKPPEWEDDTLAATIRLTRMGKKKRPFYRLVALDSRKRRDGAYLANLGYYNPFVEPHEVRLHTEEILSWLQKGVEVRDTARSLLKREGVLYHFSLLQAGLGQEEIQERMAAWRPQQAARLQRDHEAILVRRRQIDEAEQKRREDAEAAAAKAAADAAAPAAASGEAGAADESGEASQREDT